MEAFDRCSSHPDPPADILPRHRQCLAGILSALIFKLLMGGLVVLNLGFTIVVTDITAEENTTVPFVVQLGLYFTLCMFFAEITCRIYVERRRFFDNRFNVFDMLVIGLDVLIEVISLVGQSYFPSIAVLRVLKVVRVSRAIGYMRDVRELYLMLHGIASAMKAILWAAFLIGVVMLLWSIVAVELIHPLNKQIAATGLYVDCDRCPHAYASVGSAFLTFITAILAGDNWGEISLPIMERYPLTIPFFVAVLFSVQLGLLNLILAVIVERAHEAREEDHQQKRRERHEMLEQSKKRLRRFFKVSDHDNNNTLSKQELIEGIANNEEFADVMNLLDLGADDMSILFAIMDNNGDGEIEADEFIDQIFKMRTQDTQTLLLFIKHVVQELRGMIGAVRRLDPSEGSASGNSPVRMFSGNTPIRMVSDQSQSPDTLRARMPDQMQLPGIWNQDAAACGHHTEFDRDAPWSEWQQWKVSHDDFVLADNQESANHINHISRAFDSVNRQIAEDLAALMKNIQRQVEEVTLSCKVSQHSASHESGNANLLTSSRHGTHIKDEVITSALTIHEGHFCYRHHSSSCTAVPCMTTD